MSGLSELKTVYPRICNGSDIPVSKLGLAAQTLLDSHPSSTPSTPPTLSSPPSSSPLTLSTFTQLMINQPFFLDILSVIQSSIHRKTRTARDWHHTRGALQASKEGRTVLQDLDARVRVRRKGKKAKGEGTTLGHIIGGKGGAATRRVSAVHSRAMERIERRQSSILPEGELSVLREEAARLQGEGEDSGGSGGGTRRMERKMSRSSRSNSVSHHGTGEGEGAGGDGSARTMLHRKTSGIARMHRRPSESTAAAAAGGGGESEREGSHAGEEGAGRHTRVSSVTHVGGGGGGGGGGGKDKVGGGGGRGSKVSVDLDISLGRSPPSKGHRRSITEAPPHSHDRSSTSALASARPSSPLRRSGGQSIDGGGGGEGSGVPPLRIRKRPPSGSPAPHYRSPSLSPAPPLSSSISAPAGHMHPLHSEPLAPYPSHSSSSSSLLPQHQHPLVVEDTLTRLHSITASPPPAAKLLSITGKRPSVARMTDEEELSPPLSSSGSSPPSIPQRLSMGLRAGSMGGMRRGGEEDSPTSKTRVNRVEGVREVGDGGGGEVGRGSRSSVSREVSPLASEAYHQSLMQEPGGGGAGGHGGGAGGLRGSGVGGAGGGLRGSVSGGWAKRGGSISVAPSGGGSFSSARNPLNPSSPAIPSRRALS